MHQLIPDKIWIFIFWFALTVVSLYVRPLFPVDETRYASVAWEMWIRHDFLVPHLNGVAYSHKPPLLFWLIQLSWWIFGVNEYSMRMIGPLFALAALYLTGHISQMLWPFRLQAKAQTRYILFGFFIWMLSGTLTMFDMILTVFVLLGIYGLFKLAFHGLIWRRWVLLGIAIGGGILTKGPVIFVHLLPVALFAPWWRQQDQVFGFRWLYWYLGLLFAISLGVAIALSWAIPAGISGGDAYQNAIFLGQTSGRLVKSFSHRLPWWWYLQMLPLLMLPWLLWRSFWQGITCLHLKDNGVRFCIAWLLPVLIAFSLISGKRIHYLLPLFPGIAMLLFRGFDALAENSRCSRVLVLSIIYLFTGVMLILLPVLNESWHWHQDISHLSPVWGILLIIIAACLFFGRMTDRNGVFRICLSSIAAFLVLESAFFSIQAYRYDLTPPAKKIVTLRAAGSDVAFYGAKYHGQYNFLGRLRKPLTTIKHKDNLMKWAENHTTDYIIIRYKRSEKIYQQFDHFPFKGRYVAFLPVKEILAKPSLLPY